MASRRRRRLLARWHKYPTAPTPFVPARDRWKSGDHDLYIMTQTGVTFRAAGRAEMENDGVVYIIVNEDTRYYMF